MMDVSIFFFVVYRFEPSPCCRLLISLQRQRTPSEHGYHGDVTPRHTTVEGFDARQLRLMGNVVIKDKQKRVAPGTSTRSQSDGERLSFWL